MKNPWPGIICLMLLFNSIALTAQMKSVPVREPDANRPTLFKNLPSRINCRINALESLLESPVGIKVSIQLDDDTQFQGTVSSVSSQNDNNIKSVVIRSMNMEGATLTFSKIIKEDGSSYFTGRIISFRHADAYEIKFEKGQYAFVKKGFYDMINE